MATKRSKKRSRKRKTRRKGGAALNDSGNRKSVMPEKFDFIGNPLPDIDNAFTIDPQTRQVKMNDDVMVRFLSFWAPIFGESELVALKQKLLGMLSQHQQIASKAALINERREAERLGPTDPSRSEVTKEMNDTELKKKYKRRITKERSACEIVKQIFPGYSIPVVVPINFADSDYKFLCCTTMLLYGMISCRLLLTGQEYQLMFKGGRALQMLTSTHGYISEDVDIQIVPTTQYRQENLYDPKNVYPYDRENIKNLSGHIALLIKYLLPLKTSILTPSTDLSRSNNRDLYKISFSLSGSTFRAISDIDFKELVETRRFYTDPEFIFDRVDEIKVLPDKADRSPHENVLFTHQNKAQMLGEKTYLYTKYRGELEAFKNVPMEKLKEKENVERLMDKFKKAVLAIDPETDLDDLYRVYLQKM